nr:hypothetical protein [uncultured Campylobacter sp.]
MSKFDAIKFERHDPHLYGANQNLFKFLGCKSGVKFDVSKDM